MHTYHADIHDVGLQDDCDACREHAEAPWITLDSGMLRDLVQRNYFYRYGESVDDEIETDVELRRRYAPRTENEAIAMRNITDLMERMGALMKHDTQNLIQSYLERKWGIEFECR